MRVPRFDSTPVCGKTVYSTPVDQRPSAFNHSYTRASAMPYGRQMRGMDGIPDGPFHDSWGGKDLAVQEASIADDNVGNGIFDGPGAPPVQNAGSGVFEARYAEPGYLYRERAGLPSEVLDQTTGEPLIFNANAGGSSHEDFLRTYRRWDEETPRYYSSPPYVQPQFLDGLGCSSCGGKAMGELSLEDDTTKYAIGGLLLGVGAAIMYKMYKEGSF